MRIEKRTMGWIQKPSAWQYNQQLAAKRRARAQANLQQQTMLSTAIFSAKDNAAAEHTALVFKSVIQRVSKEAQERLEKALPTDLLDRVKSAVDTKA